MRNKWIALALGAALTAGLLSGCAMADPEDGAEADRLIGMYITPETLNLFDLEGYLNDHLGRGFSGGEITGDTSAYAGRMYAKVSEPDEHGWREYAFPVDGASCFLVPDTETMGGQTVTSPGVDGLKLSYTDEGKSMEATLYLDARKGRAAFFNPVYQTADGEVYLTAGQGISIYDEASAAAGGSFSHTQTVETSATGPDGETVTERFSVEVGVSFWTPPDRVAVTQMSDDGAVLGRDEFAGDSLPDALDREPGTAYFIVEEYRSGQETARTLEAGDAEYLWFRTAGEGVFCGSHGVEIK